MAVNVLAYAIWNLRRNIKPTLDPNDVSKKYYLIYDVKFDVIADFASTPEEAGLKCYVADNFITDADRIGRRKFLFLDTSYQTIKDILDGTDAIDDKRLLELVENRDGKYEKMIKIENLDLLEVHN